MNTKTSSQKSPKIEKSLILKVEEILGMSQKEISENDEVKDIVSGVLQGKYTSEKDLILDLIVRDGQNYAKIDKKLKQDRDVMRTLLLSHPDLFYMIPAQQKKDVGVLHITVESMVKSGKDIFQIEIFIESLQIPQKTKEKLFEFHGEVLSKRQGGNTKSIEGFLSAFRISFPELYIYFRDTKFFENRDGILKFSEKTKKIFQELREQFSQDEEKESRKKDLLVRIANIFGMDPNKKDPLIQGFLQWIGRTIEKEPLKKKREDISESDSDGEEEQEELEQEEDTVYTQEYSYRTGSTGTVNFDISGGKQVSISEIELQDMSSRALENYLSFLELFDTLGLSFLSRKYRHQFFSLGEVDYLHGEGITEGKILKLLNLIGRNIGVPEENYEDEKGNKKTGCFQTLPGAKLAFQDIRATGKISEKLVCEPSRRGDHSIVEIYMMHHQLLDTQGNGLNRSKWK